MARFRTNVLHWGDKYDGPDTYKDCRRGAGPDAFWDETELVEYPKAKRGKDKVRKRYPGCPGNNNKSHVFVWTTQYEDTRNLFYRYFGFHKHERKVCAGCAHRDARRTTERYDKKKMGLWPNRKNKAYSSYRWWCWESYDEGYAAFRKEHVSRYGFTEAFYDW